MSEYRRAEGDRRDPPVLLGGMATDKPLELDADEGPAMGEASVGAGAGANDSSTSRQTRWRWSLHVAERGRVTVDPSIRWTVMVSAGRENVTSSTTCKKSHQLWFALFAGLCRGLPR
jgi:hypothetical protein